MRSRDRYNRNMFELIHDNFGTFNEFAKHMSIGRLTAYRYAKNPDAMSVGFVRRLSKKINKPLSSIIQDAA